MNAKVAAFTAAQSTESLTGALLILEAKGDLSPEERLVRAWTIEALENRYPVAAAAVEAAFYAAETIVMNDPKAAYPDVDYVAILLTHIPA